MKRRINRFLATFLAALLCLSMLAACSSSSEEESSASDSSSSSSESSDSSEESEDSSASSEESSTVESASESSDTTSSSQEEVVIGELTYIGNATLVLELYEADSEITGYTNLDGVTLTATGESESVVFMDSAVYQSAVGGPLTEITFEDLAEGDMLAVITDGTGSQEFIVLDAAVSSESGSEDSATAEDSTASQEETSSTTTE